MARSGKKREACDLVDQIREAIRDSGQSLYQISQASGIAASQLSRFMRGERTLTLPAAARVCQSLHLRLITDPSAPDVQEGPPPGPKPSGERKAKRKPKAD